MLINPQELSQNLDRLEEIEKVSLRLVTQAIFDYRTTAEEIFREESDLVTDIGEDITREALDRLGMPKIDQRIFGKVDYKRACYLFHPDYALKQALFVDSKAEKVSWTRYGHSANFATLNDCETNPFWERDGSPGQITFNC